MKTLVPDSRNFAYLNWKQVDALPSGRRCWVCLADGGERTATDIICLWRTIL